LLRATGVFGIFIVLGYFANKRHQWSFKMGIVVYFFDMLFAVALEDFLSIAIHVVALIAIYIGLEASIKLNEIEKKRISIVT